jgi:DNA-binding transcriptional LysR family regulator
VFAVPRPQTHTIVAFVQRTPKAAEKLPWDDVRLFLALCRSRTVGEAAAALGVDASTVSRRLAALEATLSATLFDRGRDGIARTQAAEDLMPVAEEIEGAMARFATEAEGLERLVSGSVRIACPPDVAEVFVAPLVPELRANHPSLRIEIAPGETVLDLTRREADLALRTVRPARGDLVVTRLLTVRWVLVAAPEVARSAGTLRSWSDAPWVTWGERLSSTPPARWFATHARDAEPVVRTDSLMLQLALVRKGVGVALVPEPSVEHYGLVPVKTSPALRDASSEWPSDELFLVTHRALRQVPRVRAVWDLLVARARCERFGGQSSRG